MKNAWGELDKRFDILCLAAGGCAQAQIFSQIGELLYKLIPSFFTQYLVAQILHMFETDVQVVCTRGTNAGMHYQNNLVGCS
jgi:hypothetical protein